MLASDSASDSTVKSKPFDLWLLLLLAAAVLDRTACRELAIDITDLCGGCAVVYITGCAFARVCVCRRVQRRRKSNPNKPHQPSNTQISPSDRETAHCAISTPSTHLAAAAAAAAVRCI